MKNKIYLAGQYFLNHDLKPEEIKKQVREIANAGYQAVFAHARQGLKTPYFSNSWWEIIKIIVEECRNNGIKFAIWDEDYYPSAIAGNRIIWNNPELSAQNLEFTIGEFKSAHTEIKMDLKDAALLKCYAFQNPWTENCKKYDLTDYCGTVRTEWGGRGVRTNAYSETMKIGMPHWRTGMDERSKKYALHWLPDEKGDYLVVAVQVQRPNGTHNTDILNKKTIEEFIRYTHEEYTTKFPADIKEIFHASFMDEPAPGGLFPWTDNFVQEFINDHGYDITDKLAHLAVDLDNQSYLIRHHYRMTQMRLQCSNYLDVIRNWCECNDIFSVGHLSRTEHLAVNNLLWPNELRCCKYLDIPCTDPLGAGIAWPDAAAYHTGLKVASSAAHIFGKEQAGSDALAVMGNETSLRDLKFAIDYQMVLGINYFNLHGLSYSIDGPRKDEVPPSLFYQHSEWEYMPELLSYIKETCAKLSEGKHLCKIGVLYPSTTFYSRYNLSQSWNADKHEAEIHKLSELLLSNQKDFDFIDEITLSEHSEGSMPEDWEIVILPNLEFIDRKTKNAIENFIKKSGKVIVTGKMPQILDNLETPVTNWDINNIQQYKSFKELPVRSLPGPKLEGIGKEDVFVLRRQKEDNVISFLFNRSESIFKGEYEGKTIFIPPKNSLLIDGSKEESHCDEKVTPYSDINSDWKIKFPENHLPLAFWKAEDDLGNWHNLNLMERQLLSGKIIKYKSRFLYSGKVEKIKIIFDKSAVNDNAQIFCNGILVENFKDERIFDCLNVSADISNYIRSGTTPSNNEIVIISENDNNGLQEVPYLHGDFFCKYQHASRALPFLRGKSSEEITTHLLSWQELGYPTFSGTAEYLKEINIGQAGKYKIELGRVEDLAEVFFNGKKIKLLPWEFYSCHLGYLEKGAYKIKIKVANNPGNRDRLAMLSSGLLGPVKLSIIS